KLHLRHPRLNPHARLAQHRQVLSKLRRATPRQNRDQRFHRLQTLLRAQRDAIPRRAHFAHQRVPDKLHRHARIPVKLFLKGENTKCLRKPPPPPPPPPRTPSPELRTNEVRVADPAA